MREHKGNSMIALPRDYIAIDTETTGLDYEFCSIIEVTAIKYHDGKQIDKFTSLVKPPLRHFWRSDDGENWTECRYYIDAFISNLTGITNEMLETAPAPDDVIPAFIDFLGDSVLIGHNVNFDINFLYDTAFRIGSKPITNNFVDTLRIARKVFPNLPHHRLSDIAEACNIAISQAHRSEADTFVTAACYEKMRSLILESMSEEEFIESFVYRYKNQLGSIKATTDEMDKTNPIYGKTVVFTGALSCMPRKDAFQIVLNLGGNPVDSLNAKCNFLVIGSKDFAKSVKDGKSNKMKKAESLLEKGGDISVLSEAAFFDMIEDYT